MGSRWGLRVFTVHQWLGLVVGVFLLAMALTGSVLVFQSEIEHAGAPDVLAAPGSTRESADQLLSVVHATAPDAKGISLRQLSADGDVPVEASFDQDGKQRVLFLDPFTGRVLGEGSGRPGWLRTVLKFHHELLVGKIGEVLVFLIGFCFVGSVLSGIWVYRRQLVNPFRVGVRVGHGSHRVASDLHHMVGVTALLFNLMMGATGMWMRRDSFGALFGASDEDGPPRERRMPMGMGLRSDANDAAAPAAPVSLDSLMRRAEAALPGFKATGVRIGDRPGQGIRVTGRAGWNPLIAGRASVQFNAANGAQERVSDPRTEPWTKQVDIAIKPLHHGDYAGLPVKLLYLFGAFAPAILSITGFMLWWRRRGQSARGADAMAVTPRPRAATGQLATTSSPSAP